MNVKRLQIKICKNYNFLHANVCVKIEKVVGE